MVVDFHDFPWFLGKSGKWSNHPPKVPCSVAEVFVNTGRVRVHRRLDKVGSSGGRPSGGKLHRNTNSRNPASMFGHS